METTKSELEDMLLNNKPKRAKLNTLFNFNMASCLQNTLNSAEWKTGDPNDETPQAYDFLWIVWVLRHIFPKDVVTHFINLNGGVGFTLYRSLPIAGIEFPPRLELRFWRDSISTIPVNSMEKRKIYFNIALERIKIDRTKVYVWYKDGKSYYINSE